MSNDVIQIVRASQNNLKGLNLKLPLGELIVITGVSGSGKSSLAFDTVYAEGQRRYVETFSPYARQFLDRMDKPQVERIDGIPPAIAIDQVNPVRTSRSTVGTMTELNDHIKLLFARGAQLYCSGCGRPVVRDTPESIHEALRGCDALDTQTILITFPIAVPKGFSHEEIHGYLLAQGYTKFHRQENGVMNVVQDRVRLSAANRSRIIEALESALRAGRGHLNVYQLESGGAVSDAMRFSSDLHCPDCGIGYRDPTPNLFSFNSPIGACDTCRGFGRVMDIDYNLVIPDETKTLAEGAVKPWQTDSYRECQDDLIRFARKRGINTALPWRDLTTREKQWVIEGEGDWDDKVWYGVKRFFNWLETKSYKMHIRVLLSKYRAYNTCPSCQGARLKSEAFLWRLGYGDDAERSGRLPGLTIHDVMLLSIDQCSVFFDQLSLPAPLDKGAALLLKEIRSRLHYIVEVGLGYLTLDRQSRTLSGGEVQRINLTTALGTGLVNTLFVLDEPSIGLHARDVGRIIRVLHRLRDTGNSLIVVEHDPQLILAADRILDLGPGPGERGGKKIFFGTKDELLSAKRSITAQYLTGNKTVVSKTSPHRPVACSPSIEVLGAAQYNLKSIDVVIPLNRLVCVTGVSGSGKSTLVRDIIYNGISKLKGSPKESVGRYSEIRGHENLSEVIFVDQSSIGKSSRSNPASYVGALSPIRKLFALEPLAIERGYNTGTFSFNSGTGRCPTCSGSGFERVEMQFLSDVYLRCPDCDGRRYRAEILDVQLAPRGRARNKRDLRVGGAYSIADVLDFTVSEAIQFFSDESEIIRALQPLRDVGLSYLKLGQPVPTLSGGEAQRLKLAGHLAKSRGFCETTGTLFLFDEPTTGLHLDDIATLVTAFNQLIARGHSLVVIEHNLDVIRAADWIIDLGPEGGPAGGNIVGTGTPADIAGLPHSHTGRALRDYTIAKPPAYMASDNAKARLARQAADEIRILNAREHNLKNVVVKIPHNKLTVITGVSGSGKSTVAFDILFAEGQRRYLESLNAYARQFVQPVGRPDVDAISGIPPTVAIEQRNSRGGRKSTVATLTEIYHFLRLLFVKLGTQYCPNCNVSIQPQTSDAILGRLIRDYAGVRIRLLAPLVVGRKGYYTDLAKWARMKGYSQLRVDGVLTSTAQWPRLDRFKEHSIELPVGDVVASARSETQIRELLDRALVFGKGVVHVAPLGRHKGRRTSAKTPDQSVFSTRRACHNCGRSFAELDPRLFSFNSRHGWCERCFGTGLSLPGFNEEQTGEEVWWNAWWEGTETPCSACRGARLRPDALSVRFHGQSIADITALPVSKVRKWLSGISLRGREKEIARDILTELSSRLTFLEEVGLNYLALDRAAPSLSGGEAQRIRLAAQLGSNLRGVCYILDEPTIGLHPRDNRMLLNTLTKLMRKGNTVVVVEHDEDSIRRANYIVDLGPGAGKLGGRVVAQGTLETLMNSKQSVTGRLLARPICHPQSPKRAIAPRKISALRIAGATLNNLKNVSCNIPLGRLVCVTGVSGSGKSTLVREIVYTNVRQRLEYGRKRAKGKNWLPHGCRHIQGWESIGRVLEVDQAPIGKTSRSCPATYVGFWDSIRRLFAEAPEARIRGYTPSRFSFNVKEGRCEACEGQGIRKIEMNFLPDVKVMCNVCSGMRFTPETLAVRFKNKDIGEVLAMCVDEAIHFFAAHASIHHALTLLQDVGLGYLTLGQPSPTLSGGEAQRIKLVTELAKIRPNTVATPHTSVLYILDEPTIGLHMADVEKLIVVLHRLVDAGNSVLLIEHNLDVIAEADWIIDLGPEGGDGGGRVVAQGPPQNLSPKRYASHTARILTDFLKERRGDTRP